LDGDSIFLSRLVDGVAKIPTVSAEIFHGYTISGGKSSHGAQVHVF
jgi:hypothetical protein